MQDSFYFQKSDNERESFLLRTQTSSVQIRFMEQNKPPLGVISIGKVYRRDDYDATHTPMFHQIEGLYVAEKATMCNLRWCLEHFLNEFFRRKIKTRFRPSFFPFTEPSAEVDIEYTPGKFLEILGCGMVHPNVLKAVKIDSDKYRGFAFGIGVERIAMLKLGIEDIRDFFAGDMRWLEYYGSRPFTVWN